MSSLVAASPSVVLSNPSSSVSDVGVLGISKADSRDSSRKRRRYPDAAHRQNMTKTTPTTQWNTPAAAHLTAKETLSAAQAQARQFTESCNLTAEDVEDIAQDAILELLRRGSTSWTAEASRNAVHGAIDSEMSQRFGRHPEDAQIMAALEELVILEQLVLERDLTDPELNDLARDVRRNWVDQAERPTVEFAGGSGSALQYPEAVADHGDQVLSLSDPAIAAEAGRVAASMPADEGEGWWPDEFAAEMVAVAHARRSVWNHFSTSLEVPDSPSALVGMLACRSVFRSVRERGGVVAVANAVLACGAQADWADPLFAPWPFADEAKLRRIAQVLTMDRRRFAEVLWVSALDTVASETARGILDSGLRPTMVIPASESGVVGHVYYARPDAA